MTVQLFVVAHAPLASAWQSLALHAYAECSAHVHALDVPGHWSLQQATQAVREACPQGDTLVLLDVAGATPANAVREALASRADVRVLHGLNLPMLWRALCYRDEGLQAVLQRAQEGGLRGIEPLS